MMLNRIAGAVLGLLLLALGLLVAVEAAFVAAGRAPWPVPVDRWRSTLGTVTWSERRVLVLSIVAGLVGLLVLVAQLRRRPPDRVSVGSPEEAVWWLNRRSVEQRVAFAAGAVEGVHHPRASISGRENQWRLKVRAEARPNQNDAVKRAVWAELDRLGTGASAEVDVALRSPRRVS